MNSQRQPVDPDRLVEAAIVVLRACTEYAASHDGRSVHPTELADTTPQARALTQFSKFEIEEATQFLVRLGYLEPVKKAAR
jgi:hypothetical protein